MAVAPATGMKRHAYEASDNVSRSTPYTPLICTSLLGMMNVFGSSSPAPPVPTMISRIPATESGVPSGRCGAKRS